MKKRILTNIIYSPLYVLIHGMAHLPFCVLYRISDFMYLMLYYIIGYRLKIVKKNIAESFPEKSEKEQKTIISRFYKQLADYIVETVKLLHISEKEVRRRMVFENMEIVDELLEKGISLVVYAGHYANWEYLTTVKLWSKFDHDSSVFAQIYRPLNNKWFDALFLRIRSTHGTVSFKMKSALRDLIRVKQSGKVSLTGFLSDQHPSGNDSNHVLSFFNHDTAFITGTEAIARKLGFATLYFDVERIMRGYYKTTMRVIQIDPSEVDQFVITDRYVALLERSIHRDPALWLWTHNRWKHKVGTPQPSKA